MQPVMKVFDNGFISDLQYVCSHIQFIGGKVSGQFERTTSICRGSSFL